MRKLFLLVSLCLSSCVTAATAAKPAVLEIEGEIDGATIIQSLQHFTVNKGDVYITIESNGGRVDAAEMLIKMIETRKAAGFTVRCYSTRAVSAAFFIFSYCSERSVSPYGSFMMHYPFFVGRITLDNIAKWKTDLEADRVVMDAWASTIFKKKAPIIITSMKAETWYTGATLCKTFPEFCRIKYKVDWLEAN